MRPRKDFPSDRDGKGEERKDVNLALDRLFTMSCRHRMGGERECDSIGGKGGIAAVAVGNPNRHLDLHPKILEVVLSLDLVDNGRLFFCK
jgi:hypothetical protein